MMMYERQSVCVCNESDAERERERSWLCTREQFARETRKYKRESVCANTGEEDGVFCRVTTYLNEYVL